MRGCNYFRFFKKICCCTAFLFLSISLVAQFQRQLGEVAETSQCSQKFANISVDTQKFANNTYIYTSVAYLLSSCHIRVIIVKKCDDSVELSATIEDEIDEKVTYVAKLTPYHNECPWKGCTYEGFFADFHLESDFSGDKMSLSKEPGQSVTISVRKAIPSNNPSHFLAVCVAAMSYYENSAQLIRFIEYWTLVGTTKFIIYWQSITVDIQNIIAFYQKSSDIDIEMIAWPRLPKTEDDREFYYSGQLTSINDCLLRARGQARFVAVVDLDEYIVSFSGTLIDQLKEVKTNAAGLMFYSKFAGAVNNFDEVSIVPKSNDFSEWTSIMLEKKTNKERSKIIAKPETIRRGNIHFAEEFEGNTKQTVVVPKHKAIIVHFREFIKSSSPEFIKSNILATTVAKMAQNWQKRIEKVSSNESMKITNGHRQIYENIHSCLGQIWSWSNGTCFTASRCSTTKLFGNICIDWLFATQSWIMF